MAMKQIESIESLSRADGISSPEEWCFHVQIYVDKSSYRCFQMRLKLMCKSPTQYDSWNYPNYYWSGLLNGYFMWTGMRFHGISMWTMQKGTGASPNAWNNFASQTWGLQIGPSLLKKTKVLPFAYAYLTLLWNALDNYQFDYRIAMTFIDKFPMKPPLSQMSTSIVVSNQAYGCSPVRWHPLVIDQWDGTTYGSTGQGNQLVTGVRCLVLNKHGNGTSWLSYPLAI